MPANAVNLGTLNRIRASVQYSSNPQLNVISANLGRAGISMVPTSNASDYLPQMQGAVPSPAPYQTVRLSIHLVRSQGLAASYRTQIETTTSIGDITVIPDTSNFPDYNLSNCSIINGSSAAFNGSDADFIVEIEGTYAVNSALFDAG